MNRTAIVLLTIATLASGVAFAQDRPSPIPPENARKLSQILATVEQRSDFRYVSNVEWDEDGYYDITYFTGDKAKVEIKIDAVTGEPR